MILCTVERSRRKVVGTLSMPALILCLGATTTTGVFGCSAAARVEEQKVSQAPAVSPAQPQPSTREKLPQAVIKEVTLEEQPFKVQELRVQEESGQTIIRVQFSNPVTQYRHFPLTQPSRLVLDIFGEAKQIARVESFRVDTNWVGTLRLSSGDGYLRLVAEIAAANIPAYVIEPDNGGLKLIIGSLDPKATAKKDLQPIQAGKRTDIKVVETKASAVESVAKAPSPQAALTGEKRHTGQRISLDFKDADIKNVFRLLAEVSGLNIVVTADVAKRVTVRLVDVPWDQALDLLVDTNGLGKDQIGNVVRISTTEQLKRESDARAAADKAKDNEQALLTTYLSINYAKAKDLEGKIKPLLSPRGSVIPDERSNVLLIRDIKKSLDDVNILVSKLDTRTSQVLIESNLIETTPTFSRALGMKLQFDAPIHENTVAGRSAQVRTSFPAGAPATDLDPFFKVVQARMGAFKNITAELTAAENQGNIRIISRPSVVTLNNVPSTIQSLRILRVALPSSTNIASGTGSAAGAAVATEKIPVGIILTVTPQVSSDGFVLMNITVKSSSLGTKSDGAAVPDELTREAISNVLVRDGETIVIGGIMKDTAQDEEKGIPFLKDIPILGWLFKNIRWQKDLEELMVFITPRIIEAGSENLPTAEQLWRDQLKKTEGG
jgi:type IV pilus secretin PilQ/predicted competence protein